MHAFSRSGEHDQCVTKIVLAVNLHSNGHQVEPKRQEQNVAQPRAVPKGICHNGKNTFALIRTKKEEAVITLEREQVS